MTHDPPSPPARRSRPGAAARLLRALRVSLLSLFLPRAAAQPIVPPESAVSDDVFYQIMPIAWRHGGGDEGEKTPGGSPVPRFGNFRGMTDSLDYLERLGITAIWMTPIFPSPAYHGYQHMPADRLNPRLGTEAEWTAFVRAAHARRMKVFIDLVAYGINTDSEYFKDAFKNPASKYDQWLAFTDEGNTKYTGYTFKTWDGSSVGFIHWDLNHPEPRRLVSEWARKWLDPDGDGDLADGVDGFRLDHVWAKYKDTPPSKNGWGYNLDDFWRPWKESLRQVNPGVFTFAEQAQWESTGADLVAPDAAGRRAFDAAFTKPFELAAREAVRTGKARPLHEAMRRALQSVWVDPNRGWNERMEGTLLAILGDHDVDRLASVVEPEADKPARAIDDATNLARCKLMAAILLTQPFTPVIYMGDEIGMRGVRQKYGSDANDIPVREPFKWKAVAGTPMSNYWAANKEAVEGAFSGDHDGRSVEEQQDAEGSLLEEYRALIALRKQTPELRRGSYREFPARHESVCAFARELEELRQVVVVLNLSDQPVTTAIDLSRLRMGIGNRRATVHDLQNRSQDSSIHPHGLERWGIALPPYGYRVLSLEWGPDMHP